MRSLRSTKRTEIPKTVIISQDENSNSKMCIKRSKPTKKIAVKKRPVLADKTNSGSDMNSSTSTSGVNISPSALCRPKRIQRVPAKFIDHELIKTPVKKNLNPSFSSTPLSDNPSPARIITRNKCQIVKTTVDNSVRKTVKKRIDKIPDSSPEKPNLRINTRSKIVQSKISPQESQVKLTPVKEKSQIEIQEKNNVNTPNTSKVCENTVKNAATPIYKKSFKLLEKPKIFTPDRHALYEFDFDPREEPSKPKKKRIRKKPAKKKKEVSSDDAALQILIQQLKKIQEEQRCKKLLEKKKALKSTLAVPKLIIQHEATNIQPQDNKIVTNVENLLSPIPKKVYSPRPPSPFDTSQFIKPAEKTAHSAASTPKGQNISSFLDLPVASSSLIQGSAQKPAASPWRVIAQTENRKWPVNFYVKPSMTPSYDRDTFHVIGLDKSNNSTAPKKHVYTNISLAEPENEQNESQKPISWKQTSILSFYEESFKKTAKKRSHSPQKPNELYNFDDYPLSPAPDESDKFVETVQKTPEKLPIKEIENPTIENCFGFDDSAEFDQENVSPAKIPKIKNINMIRGGFLKNTRRRAGILKEINAPVDRKLPTRVSPTDVRNVLAKHKDIISQENQEVEKAIAEADTVTTPEKELEKVTRQNLESDESNEDQTASTSVDESAEKSKESEVGLFEELLAPDVVHFTKPSRRSYERKRKPQVTFQQIPSLCTNVTSDKEAEESDYNSDSTLASKEKAKKLVKKKKKQSAKNKKEEKEVAMWAASFNSMLEEVDDFPLVIE